MNIRNLFKTAPVALGIAVAGLALVACGSTGSATLPSQTVIKALPAAQVRPRRRDHHRTRRQ